MAEDDLEHLDFAAPDRSPALTFDQIREGSQQLLVQVRERVAALSVALEEGRFIEAMGRAQEVLHQLAPLAQAENHIGVFASSYLVRAQDVCEGMTLRIWGTVTGVENVAHPVPGEEPCQHVTLSFADHEDVDLHGAQEVVALREPHEHMEKA